MLEAPESQSLEIITMLDDTVVSVEHLEPGAARLSRATTFMFAAAALSLALFAGAAIHAARIGAENRERLRAWLAAGQAEIDFRPLRVSPLADVAGLAALAAGLGLAGLGLWRAGQERRPATDERGLVAFSDGGWHVRPVPGLTVDDSRPGPRVRARLGAATILIAPVTLPPAAERVALQLDNRSLASGGVSALAHALLIVLFFLLPATANGWASDQLDETTRSSLIHVKPAEDPKLERGQGAPGAEPAGKPAAPAAAPGPKQAAAKAKSRRTDAEPHAARPLDAPQARQAGMLAVIRARTAAFESLTATADFSSDFNDEDVRGNWQGGGWADAGGYGGPPGGNGPHGRGPGPGGVIAGDYRTTPGSVPGFPGNGLPGRTPKPTFDIGRPEIPEGVDRNLIRRYVHRKHDQIAWCYQRELTVAPSLAGTATMAFTIDQNGRVIEASARGLGAATVERCLEDVIRSIAFPAGDLIHVTAYPFIFHPVGG